MDSARVQSISKSVPANCGISKTLEGGSVGCLKIIKDKSSKDKSSKAESQTPDAGLVSASTAAPRRVGRNPHLSQHCSTKARGSTPASQPALQHQGAWVETRVPASTAAPRRVGRAWVDTRVSIVTALVMGSITAHITRKVNPHYGVFLGGTFAPEISINSPIAMEKGSNFFRERSEKNLT